MPHSDTDGERRGLSFFSGTPARPVYVDYVRSSGHGQAKPPIILVHGGCHTGACYLATPDGRDGWASLFAAAGHDAYVMDWPGHGRSPVCDDLQVVSTKEIAESLCILLEAVGPAVVIVHSASGPMGWWAAEQLPKLVLAVIGIAPGPPANLLPRLPEARAELAKLSEDASLSYPIYMPEDQPVRVGQDFIAKFWANSPRFPKHALASYALSLVPESAKLFNERFNIGGKGLCLAEPNALAKLPMLVVTGDHDPRHPRSVDEATARYLGAEFVWLPDHGIVGNGHLLMIEDNNDQIAALILNWITTQKILKTRHTNLEG